MRTRIKSKSRPFRRTGGGIRKKSLGSIGRKMALKKIGTNKGV